MSGSRRRVWAGIGTALIATAALLVLGFGARVPVNTVYRIKETRVIGNAEPLAEHSAMTGTVNANTADLDTLCTVPGIGPVTARAIIEEREKNGPFLFDEDLLYVKGIGKKTLAKLMPYLTLGAQAPEGK